jgi:hypothetical protein
MPVQGFERVVDLLRFMMTGCSETRWGAEGYFVSKSVPLKADVLEQVVKELLEAEDHNNARSAV